MNWKEWICIAGISTGLVGCAEAADGPTDVQTSNDELAGHLGTARADGLDVRVLADGRVVFYGDIATELVTLGNVSPRTRSQVSNGLTYAQSPFAYCVSSETESACVSYLPSADVDSDVLTFGGRGQGSIDARKASDLALAMHHGGYDYEFVSGKAVFSRDGSPISCTTGQGMNNCTVDPHANGAAMTTITAQFDMLPELGADYVYEGWLIVDGAPIAAGRFDAADEVTFTFDEDYSDAAMYVLTIEPRVGDDPAPSATHIVAGAFANGVADVTIDHGAALGTDFGDAAGSFILAAPTAGDDAPMYYDKGIWFLNPAGGPAPSLELPTLPNGWVYEGWVATADGPISTGRFTDLAAADSDGAGPAAGSAGAPPFPGQDFINPPLSLPGNMAVISVEPDPDDSPAPFALKPLVGMIEDPGMGGVSQVLSQNGEAIPTGTVVLD